MKRETYKGRKIKVVAGRGADWGYTRITLNGVDMGKWTQSEDEALRSTRGTIDHADEVGASSGRYSAEWYAPGTYELCDEGHAKEIGGECGHHYCIAQRAAASPVVDEPAEETPVERYKHMSFALSTLKRIHPDERTAEQREEIRTLNADLTELLSTPPAGYAVPKAVSDLLSFAEAHGWRTSALWTAPGYEGEPFLNVQVGRLVPVNERGNYRGDRWMYSLTWHSRDCAPGKVRRFGQGTAVTPDNPATRGAPSVNAIREVIAENSESVSVAA
ncbi:hypothetical protein J7I94_19395 [Streptomyces sp. ISL-12]|uniref:hypothetical protein n=1 Tax=Streptomyces sp. ISL-12 TaxID=2819177 RepID=UPI001BE520FA|nr:hypothetical protein [Streptomyces sp. ISL-12]MBT2412699.1 hypothetical protein [Streptomyces sp. ISL-12]